MTTRHYSKRTIIVYYDDTSNPQNPGWVTRCTEFDDDKQPILGRIAMDEPLDATDLDAAIDEAATFWGCPHDEVVRYDGDLG